MHTDTPFVHQLGVTPEGYFVATNPMAPGTVAAYDPAGEKVWALQVSLANTDAIELDYLALSPDGTVAYVVDTQGIVHAREIATGRDLWTTPIPDPDPKGFARSRVALTATGDGAALFLAVYTKSTRNLNSLSGAQLDQARARIGSSIIRLSTDDGAVEWEKRVAVSPSLQDNPPVVMQLAADHAGAHLAACDARGNIHVWNGTGDELRRLPRSLYTDRRGLTKYGIVFEMQWTPDGRFLLASPMTGSSVNRLYLFDLQGDDRWVFDPFEQISAAKFDHQGRRMLWAAWDGSVCAWSLADARQLWRTPVGTGARLLPMADGNLVVATYFGQVISLDPDGQINWQRDLHPACYPKPLYEPRWLRTEPDALNGKALGDRLEQPVTPEAGENGQIVWQPQSPQQSLTLPIKIDVAGHYDLAVGIETFGTASLEVRIDDQLLRTASANAATGSVQLQHIWLRDVLLRQGEVKLIIQPRDAASRPQFALRYVELPTVVATPVQSWQVLGPFASPGGEIGMIDLSGDEFVGADDRTLRWRGHTASDGYVDLFMLATPPYTQIRTYARTVITSPQQRRVRFVVGHNRNMVVWLNGNEVYRSPHAFWWAPDATYFNADVNAGDNELIVCVDQGTKSTADHGFAVSVSNPGDLKFRLP